MELQEDDDKLISEAVALKVPEDQLVRFLQFGYVPLTWQLKFHSAARECDIPEGPVDVGCGGARGPGKSHAVFAQIALDDCQRYSGLKFLFLRQTGKAASESFEDLIFKVLTGNIKYEYSKGSKLVFQNGSKIILGGFETENDIDKYIGIEYDGMAVEELNQLTKEKIDKLKGSLRTSRTDGWRPRMYTSFNPGGRGHTFVRSEYVLPFQEHIESKKRFIPSTYLDNPHLNVEYTDYLVGLGGNLGKAWREGNFDIFEGQFFMEWDYNLHTEQPFKIPDTWKLLRTIDPSGRNGITACYWCAVDSDGIVHVYREYYATGYDSDQHARAIRDLSVGEEYHYTTIDTAAFAKLGFPETTAEVFQRNGVEGLIPSSKERVMGWDLVHQYLRHGKELDDFGREYDRQPKLKIFNTCSNLIRTLPLLVHDDRKPEDVDTTGEDHSLDSIRYLLQTLREQKSPKPLNLVEKRLKELKSRNMDYSFNYSRILED
jgi:phage terminase large subunit